MRRLRKAARLSQAAVAAHLGCTQTQVSRLEIAKRTPSKSDAAKLDEIFGLTDKQHFLRMHQRIASRSSGPGWLVCWIDEVEPAARVLRSWDPLLVPPLLQTELYARQLLSREPRITAEEVEARLQGRGRRQAVLDRHDPPLLLALVDEGVLRRQVGGAEVMRGQLDHLLRAARRPTVSVQVVDPQCLPGLLGSFMIAELPDGRPDTVQADSPAEGRVSSDPAIVGALWNRYEAIRLWAYPEHVSLRMIEDARDRWAGGVSRKSAAG